MMINMGKSMIFVMDVSEEDKEQFKKMFCFKEMDYNYV
jgi:hypothetical protein